MNFSSAESINLKNQTLIKFDNGLRLVFQSINHVKSVAIGIFVGVGVAYENGDNNGISHFTEHMLFKGTKKRTALQIAQEFDNIGAKFNAFTAREITAFYAMSTIDNLNICADVLSDMLFNSTFAETELKNEKEVVIEEIQMSEDDPAELCLDNLGKSYFGNTSLGMNILGTRENVRAFTKDDIQKFMNKYYFPGNMVISIAGNISEKTAVKIVEQYFLGNFCNNNTDKPVYNVIEKAGCELSIKDINQTNLALSFPGISSKNIDELNSLAVFNKLFGGGMSSRLFQSIREQKGLAYDVFSFMSAYSMAGTYSIYIGTSTNKLSEAISAIFTEISNVLSHKITKKEIDRGKAQVSAGLVFSSESVSEIMRRNASNALTFGKIVTLDENLMNVNSVSIEKISSILRKIFASGRCSISYVGPEISLDVGQEVAAQLKTLA